MCLAYCVLKVEPPGIWPIPQCGAQRLESAKIADYKGKIRATKTDIFIKGYLLCVHRMKISEKT